MLIYRLVMFTMLLENITKILPRVLLFIVYLLSVTFLVSYFCGDGDLALKDIVYHPIDSIKYLYRYVKWWGVNKDHLSFKETTLFFTSIALPILFFILMKSIFFSTKTLMKEWVKALVTKLFRKKVSPTVQKTPSQHSNAELSKMKKQMMQAAECHINQHLSHIKNKEK